MLPKVSFKALFTVAKQDLLPLTVERLAELVGQASDEDEDADLEDWQAYLINFFALHAIEIF